jgi:hypothetical protein
MILDPINKFLATLPIELQIKALKAMKEEHDRWECGDLTEEEKEYSEIFAELGKNMGETIDKIQMRVG